MSEQPSVSELRQVAHERCCDIWSNADRQHRQFCHRKNPLHSAIDALADRAEEAERSRNAWREDCETNAKNAGFHKERAEKAEREVERLRLLLDEMKEHEDSRHDDCELCDRRDTALRGDKP